MDECIHIYSEKPGFWGRLISLGELANELDALRGKESDAARKDLETATKENDELRAKIEALNTHRDKLSQRVQQLTDELHAARNERDTARALVAKERDAFAGLHAENLKAIDLMRSEMAKKGFEAFHGQPLL
jgi:predicted  nucleic acid-binding Zn-ribbon protein